MNKKIIAVIAVVVAIVVIVGGSIGGYIYQLSSQKIGMKDILVSLDKKTNGIEVGIITVPKEFSGTATVGISYSATSTYDATIEINNGEGKKTVPYTDFVTENGNYTFEVTFKDKTKTKDCSIYGIVTEIGVYANAKLDGTEPKIEVSVWPDTVSPLGDAVITITKVDGNMIVSGEPLTLSDAGIYTGTFSYDINGYYTIYAEMTNPVKSGSAYENITNYVKNQTGGDNLLINLAPIFIISPENTTIHYRSNDTPVVGAVASNGWAHFVSSNLAEGKSYEITFSAEDYDGGVTSIVWDVGYNSDPDNKDTNDTVEDNSAWYQYPTEIEKYVAFLYVHDEYTVSTAECTITVKY